MWKELPERFIRILTGKAQAADSMLSAGEANSSTFILKPRTNVLIRESIIEDKIRSLELIDRKIVRPVTDYLKSSGEDFRFLILPDHPTPVCLRTHSPEDVPFVLYDSRKDSGQSGNRYTEKCGTEGKLHFESGPQLTDHFFRDL